MIAVLFLFSLAALGPLLLRARVIASQAERSSRRYQKLGLTEGEAASSGGPGTPSGWAVAWSGAGAWSGGRAAVVSPTDTSSRAAGAAGREAVGGLSAGWPASALREGTCMAEKACAKVPSPGGCAGSRAGMAAGVGSGSPAGMAAGIESGSIGGPWPPGMAARAQIDAAAAAAAAVAAAARGQPKLPPEYPSLVVPTRDNASIEQYTYDCCFYHYYWVFYYEYSTQ